MASSSAMGADGYPASIEYSISTDHVFDDDRDVAEFPRGEVGPPEPGESDEKTRDKNGRP